MIATLLRVGQEATSIFKRIFTPPAIQLTGKPFEPFIDRFNPQNVWVANVHDFHGSFHRLRESWFGTMARVSEINRQRWEDVNLDERFVILYTRKKRGGHLTPRKIPMTKKLYAVLKRRFDDRATNQSWVFSHRYWSRKNECYVEGPYGDRKKVMKRLCAKAGVRYFRFHPIRHAGASMMDGNNVPIGAIQRILGHENRKTTEIYLHSIGDLERSAIETFERARTKSHTDSHTE